MNKKGYRVCVCVTVCVCVCVSACIYKPRLKKKKIIRKCICPPTPRKKKPKTNKTTVHLISTFQQTLEKE